MSDILPKLPKPETGPDMATIEALNKKVLQRLKMDFENFKNSNFPVKTGYLKANTTYDLVGSEGVINYPDYLPYIRKGQLLRDLIQYMEQKYIERFNEEKRKIEWHPSQTR